MGGLLWYVEMESTSFIQPWLGGTGHLVQHWSLFGRLKENMLLEKALPRSRFSAKISRFLFYVS